MTKKERKIEKRNQLLKAFNPNAINIETLNMGMAVTFFKGTVKILENGCVNNYKMHSVMIENNPITYIIK